jgi:hypothetical protein
MLHPRLELLAYIIPDRLNIVTTTPIVITICHRIVNGLLTPDKWFTQKRILEFKRFQSVVRKSVPQSSMQLQYCNFQVCSFLAFLLLHYQNSKERKQWSKNQVSLVVGEASVIWEDPSLPFSSSLFEFVKIDASSATFDIVAIIS